SSNTLHVVVVADTVSVYVNGRYAAQFPVNTFSGRAGLIATTFDESNSTSCTFTDAWVWNLAFQTPEVALAPTLTPTVTPSPTFTPSPTPTLTPAERAGITPITVQN